MKRYLHYVLATMLFLSCEAAFAFESNFSNQDVGYDLYDLVFNKGLNGPLGWVVVIALVIMGFVQMAKGAMMPCLMSLGSGVMIKASPSVLKTLGATLDVIGQANQYIGTLIW